MRPKKPEMWASSAAISAAISGPAEETEAVDVSFRRTRYWLSAGVQDMASASDVRSETVIVIARARKKVPVTPVVEINGRKTTMGVIVEPIKGLVSSFKALRIASWRLCPA